MKVGDTVRVTHANKAFNGKTAQILELVERAGEQRAYLKVSGRGAQTLVLPLSALKEL